MSKEEVIPPCKHEECDGDCILRGKVSDLEDADVTAIFIAADAPSHLTIPITEDMGQDIQVISPAGNINDGELKIFGRLGVKND